MAIAQLDKPRYNGTIEFPEDYLFGEIKRAVVTLLGSAKSCKVTILSFDNVEPGQAGEQIDVLQHCTVDAGDGTLIFKGESLRLLTEQHVRDNRMTFTLKLNGKCKDCGYA